VLCSGTGLYEQRIFLDFVLILQNEYSKPKQNQVISIIISFSTATVILLLIILKLVIPQPKLAIPVGSVHSTPQGAYFSSQGR